MTMLVRHRQWRMMVCWNDGSCRHGRLFGRGRADLFLCDGVCHLMLTVVCTLLSLERVHLVKGGPLTACVCEMAAPMLAALRSGGAPDTRGSAQQRCIREDSLY